MERVCARLRRERRRELHRLALDGQRRALRGGGLVVADRDAGDSAAASSGSPAATNFAVTSAPGKCHFFGVFRLQAASTVSPERTSFGFGDALTLANGAAFAVGVVGRGDGAALAPHEPADRVHADPLALPVAARERVHQPHAAVLAVVALDVQRVVVLLALLLPERVVPAAEVARQLVVVAEHDRAGALREPR